MRFAKFIAASVFVASAIGLPQVAAHAQEDAKLRVGHFSSDAPPVDIYVDGKKTFAQVKFPLMSAYTPLASGSHTVDVRPAGGVATDPALVSLKADLAAGKNFLVTLVGPATSLQAKLIADDLAAPGKGKARVRVIHTATGGPNVDVVVGGSTKLFSNVAFGAATPYAEVDATKYDLSVRETGKTVQLVGKQVSLQEGGVYSIVAVGNPDKTVTLRGFADVPPTGTATPTGDPTGADATSNVPTTGPTTVAPATTVAATAAPTTVAATAAPTTAAPTTAAPVAETTVPAAAETTLPAETTVPADTVAPDTEAAVETTPPTEAVADTAVDTSTPKAGVDTGFGGLDGSSSTIATIGFAAVLAGFVVLALRRRSARS